MKKILCCIPTLGNIRIELAKQLYGWKQRYGSFFDVFESQIRPLYVARNECVHSFLQSDASYLFFVDSDAVPSSDAIEQLLSHGFDKKIVGGLCYEVKCDSDGEVKTVPLILKRIRNGYKIDDTKPNGLIDVDATGTICVMIHRSVFSSLPEPWFDNRAEDFYFYENAKKAGYNIYVDCNCQVRHFVEVAV
jgi:hypothetical protein